MSIRIRKYSWQLAPQSLKDIRQQVFIDEQKVPPELEWDDTDEIADHYLAVLPDNTPVGVSRMYPSVTDTAHIGRMAILPAYRGQGVGAQLLRRMMDDAVPQFQDLYLSAQLHAVPFYESNGFHVCSAPYDDAGIPHVDMRCLAPSLVLPQLDTRAAPLVLGKDMESWLFEGEAELIALTDTLANQASQKLWLYDQNLEHDLYDRFRFREILSALARRHRLSEVRLLIHDDKPLVKKRHQIIELMKRVPSKIELRLVNADYPFDDNPYLVIDGQAVLYRHGFDQATGFAQLASGGRAKLLSESFQRMWDAGSPSREFRPVSI
ncbi:GNAT family N-acetyltransferase [Marinobacter zhejiangensis]|uniref:Predicted N-acyltransferase, GNAT family n=1 Tax=Marinobacter zhejiangensis TaxID=488535 RepID=A0A1I4RGY0_9GAMM|nr:GNAT family N-acetyltransferase [Marinobacter zhejiangensis]SFM51548.1 Predicted N-acyltransferase, GNAT family [Marinobacter zhejiangensis]